VGGKAIKQTPLERAEAGFAWVVRQVRLPKPGQPSDEEAAPPAPVLRRSHGSALERALAFLAVLEQFGLDEEKGSGLQGCLVFCPDEKGNRRLWACGVAIGDNLYLFDPRLGLPLPGPGGKGVATLAQARTDPTVLNQVQVEKLRYDVTPEQAKQATVLLVCPLSAVSPRMHLLQDHLLRDRAWNQQQLPAQVRVRLAEDPTRALGSVQAAVKSSGVKAEDVQFWKEGSILLRRFLPRDEGGNDTGRPYALRQLQGFVAENDPTVVSMPRQKLFQLQAVPWEEFPDYFRDPNHFRWDIGLGQQIRGYYALSFMRQLLDANTPRDMILRGQYTKAVKQLVEEQKQWQQMRARLREAKDLGTGVREWVDRAIAAHANLIRAQGTAEEAAAQAQLDQLWKWRLGDPIEVFINGVIAGPRGAEVMYQLALCRHEQAARHQGRVALAARGGGSLPTEAANARRTWTDAADYWKEFIDINPGRPAVADARRLRGEVLAQLGQVEKAVPLWQDVSAPMSDLEKLAVLWLARQSSRGTP
jgi:hypothetical protein